ncbi:MAG: hypothetical protein WC889_12615, partial [Myxococcota bacterium]
GPTWYIDSANGFMMDLVLPYHFADEKLTIFLEANFDRDIDHGRNRGSITPGIRFLPSKSINFGFAISIPVIDDSFVAATGFGLIASFGYEFN